MWHCLLVHTVLFCSLAVVDLRVGHTMEKAMGCVMWLCMAAFVQEKQFNSLRAQDRDDALQSSSAVSQIDTSQ